MKNYYDYGCGKGETAFEAKNHHGHGEWCERDHRDEHEECHCAKVYTLDKHEHDREKDYDREDKCEYRKHDREYDGYDKKYDKHEDKCEDKCECKHGHDDKKQNRECDKNEHGYKKHDCERDEKCEKNEHECECFFVKVCIPPFPFRCRK